MNKKNPLKIFVLMFFLASCAPSVSVIHTAIAQTKISFPTNALTPTATPTATPRLTPTLAPLEKDLLFLNPYFWPRDVKARFPSLFQEAGLPKSSDVAKYDKFVEMLWFDLLGFHQNNPEQLDPAKLLTLVIKYGRENDRYETVIPVSWRDAIISRRTSYMVVYHQTGEYAPGFIGDGPAPKGYEIADSPLDWGNYEAIAGFDNSASVYLDNGQVMPSQAWRDSQIGYIFIPSYGNKKVKAYQLNENYLNGKLALLLFALGTSPNVAQDAIVEIGPDQYVFRRLQYQTQQVTSQDRCNKFNYYLGSSFWTDIWIECPTDEEVETTHIRQWNNGEEIESSRDVVMELMKAYPDFLQIRTDYSNRYYVAGVMVATGNLYVPNIPSELSSKLVKNLPTPTNTPVGELTVWAQRDWQDAGIMIGAGETISVSHISGQWKWAIGQPNWFGPEGDPTYKFGQICTSEKDSRLADTYLGGLIGKVGDEIFYLGSGQYTVKYSGESTLYVKMNDCRGGYRDNGGSVTIRIKVSEATAPTPTLIALPRMTTIAPGGLSKPPVILEIQFPSEITGSGNGVLYFADPNGDISQAIFTPVPSINNSPLYFFVTAHRLISGDTFQGAFPFSINCTNPGEVTYRVQLADKTGKTSERVTLSFTCK